MVYTLKIQICVFLCTYNVGTPAWPMPAPPARLSSWSHAGHVVKTFYPIHPPWTQNMQQIQWFMDICQLIMNQLIWKKCVFSRAYFAEWNRWRGGAYNVEKNKLKLPAKTNTYKISPKISSLVPVLFLFLLLTCSPLLIHSCCNDEQTTWRWHNKTINKLLNWS